MSDKSENDSAMNFLQHLDVLRKTIIRVAIAISVATIVAFLFREFIFDHILLSPRTPEFITNRFFCELAHEFATPSLCINQSALSLINIDLSGQFTTHLKVSFWVGIVVSTPLALYELIKFILPALKKQEQVWGGRFVAFALPMFLMGILFGYFIIVPITIHFLGTYSVSSQVLNQINLSSYISTLMGLILSTGIAFELPVVIYYLSKWGLVTPPMISHYRRHAIVGILIIAAIITPPDVISMIFVALPLYLLFEISVIISKVRIVG